MIMENITVLDAVLNSRYQTWSSMNPITLISSWRKLLPDLE
jgi:hypothetical protein